MKSLLTFAIFQQLEEKLKPKPKPKTEKLAKASADQGRAWLRQGRQGNKGKGGSKAISWFWMFTTRSKAERSWRRRQLGDHLPWRCLQKVLPRAEQTKLSETRDRLGPVGALLPLSPSPLLVLLVMFIMRRFTQFS